MSPESPVGRLAPSPTGLLHLGHARSFWVAWRSARGRGGRLILRVEDLDRARARPELVETCLADLRWLGLDWDGEILFQSADPEPYRAAVEHLLQTGRAYPCVCSRAEVTAASAPHADDGELRYAGTCRGRWPSVAAAEEETGRRAGVRLAVPDGPVRIRDELRGELDFDVQAEVGDFLLLRRDGVPAYQLAVVVDDARGQVTEVVRGDDLLSSAARQALLQEFLGLARPRWIHLPLVVDAGGRRLSKRRGDLALSSLRARGVDGAVVREWAERTCGAAVPVGGGGLDWDAFPTEPAALTERDLERIVASAV